MANDKWYLQTVKIPKQIDAEVLLFKNYTVRQSFPFLVFMGIWYVGFISMNEWYARIIMSLFFAVAWFILWKKMGNLILYEYALLFLRYVFLKAKFFLKITKDISLEPDVFEKEIDTKQINKKETLLDKIIEFIKDYLSPKKKTVWKK